MDHVTRGQDQQRSRSAPLRRDHQRAGLRSHPRPRNVFRRASPQPQSPANDQLNETDTPLTNNPQTLKEAFHSIKEKVTRARRDVLDKKTQDRPHVEPRDDGVNSSGALLKRGLSGTHIRDTDSPSLTARAGVTEGSLEQRGPRSSNSSNIPYVGNLISSATRSLRESGRYLGLQTEEQRHRESEHLGRLTEAIRQVDLEYARSQREAAQERQVLEGKGATCISCRENFEPKHMVQLPCSHWYCREDFTSESKTNNADKKTEIFLQVLMLTELNLFRWLQSSTALSATVQMLRKATLPIHT